MNKKLMLVFAFVAIAVLTVGLISSSASWNVQLQANQNTFQSGNFDVSIDKVSGPGSSKTVSAVWVSPINWAPGDDPITGTVYLHNNGNVPVNVVWSGFVLTGDPVLAANICVTAFSDSNGGVTSDDLPGITAYNGGQFVDPVAHCVTLAKIAVAFADGYFSVNSNNSYTSIFIPANGGEAFISMTLAFRAGAGNDTINKTAGFTWNLDARQLPKNPAP